MKLITNFNNQYQERWGISDGGKHKNRNIIVSTNSLGDLSETLLCLQYEQHTILKIYSSTMKEILLNGHTYSTIITEIVTSSWAFCISQNNLNNHFNLRNHLVGVISTFEWAQNKD